MKLKQWLYGATALAMLAACSDHDGLKPDGPADEGGDGYIGIKIQLPTVPVTRANDVFSDGEESEYSISDAHLLLFQGSNMASAKCTGSYILKESDPTLVGTNATQVTSTVTRVASVSGIDQDKDNHLYALVLINSVQLGLKDSDYEGQTIKGLQEMIINGDKPLFNQQKPGEEFASDIFMTNSPLSAVPGGVNEVANNLSTLPVLVELKKDVFTTEKAALDSPAGIIHVERAVGKVTCSNFPDETAVKVNFNGTEYTLKVVDVTWDLGTYMTDTYLVRNTNRDPVNAVQGTDRLWTWNLASTALEETAPKYRMLGSAEIPSKDMEGNQQLYYRPYFCQVPGYGVPKDGSKTFEDKNLGNIEMESTSAVSFKAGKGAFYPRENTFPVKYMKYGNTTRIGFWVTFQFVGGGTDITGKDFYISGVDKSTIYVKDTNGNDPLTSKAVAALSNNTAVQAAVNAALNTGKTLPAGQFASLLSFGYEDTKDGKVKIKSVAFKSKDVLEKIEALEGVFSKTPSYDFKDLISSLNNLGDFYEYTGGKVFYEVRIKHFGDDLTPWSSDDIATTIDASYGGDEDTNRNNNYLGRYGVVRNNWYDLNITNIKKLGDPADPAIWDKQWPDKPDDNKDQYIAVELRVLSWAKRIQNHEF
ncbi:MAG: Mfa1 fimbrilin C-terminal domain-containing protein [Muribaculaceae bacterium]|nr:Mfa1 fimbrilin C-terminal domain-containing protein [Muribaculaceae bacterium]